MSGIQERRASFGGVDPGHGVAGQVEEPTVLAVAQDRALVPRLICFELAPVHEDDGVRGGADSESRGQDRRGEPGKRHGQGSRSTIGWMRGEMPFWRK